MIVCVCVYVWLCIVIYSGVECFDWPRPQVANHKLEDYAQGPWHDHEDGLVEVLLLAGKQGTRQKNIGLDFI